MQRANLIALMLATSSAMLTGCAQGTVDTGDEDIAAPPAIHVELWDANPHGTNVLTAEAYEAGSFIADTPAPQPAIIDEAETCDTIVGSYHMHGLELGCATTTHVCPDMLRFAFGQACLQFENPTVQHCKQRIEAATSCEELWAMSCDVVPVADSAPAGCPDELQ
jgi:hypothetical protein